MKFLHHNHKTSNFSYVLVMKEGVIQGMLEKADISEENIMRYAIGG
jgi:ABC-type sugar transport system ATPase subunit